MTSKLWTEEQFNCPVCLDLPNDPVTIPCGHSYCMACIKDYWSKDDPKGVYSCPQCRQTFCPKPPLSRNTMLAEAVEQLRKGAHKSEVRESLRSRSRPKMSTSAVPCDMCKGERREAVKSCLSCMSSFCEAHLKPHQTKKALKQHELIAPTANMADKICTQHKYLQEFYCRQCRMFICWICTSNQHKGHECSSTKAERYERQKVLTELQAENQQRLKEREQELKDMKKMMDGMKHSADGVHSDMGRALQELQRSVERLQELLEEVLDQASLEKLGQAQEVVVGLEAEIGELKRRDVEMKDLASCEDHIHYLQTCDSMATPLEAGSLPAVQVNPDASFEPARDAVLDLRDRIEDLCNQELGKITKQVNDTTPFTLGDSGRSGQKGGIFKLFSGLASRNANSRSHASPNISVGGRPAERRGLGIGNRSPDVRSRDATRDRGNTHSPRLRERQRREDRESATRASRSSPTPSRRDSQWSRSSQNQGSPAATTPIPVTVTPASPAPAPAPAPSGGFSRMASITSIFRSHRRGTTPASPVAPVALPNNAAAGNAWGMAAVPETPTEINPGLFLDSPTPGTMNQPPAFPLLREISIESIKAPEPRAREEFLQYSVTLTLDPSTAHRRLVLTEGNTKATLQGAQQPVPDTPQRFDGWTQVLCGAPLGSLRCYWEVEWRGRGSVVGVAYGALARKGSEARSGLGYNAQSWTLELSDSCCLAVHDNEKRDIPVTYSPRLGLYLDLSAGTLEFYGVAGAMTHLHTFRANFTQPLYAAFGVGSGVGVGLDFARGQFTSSNDSVKICPM